jgi:hypothetical protein
MSILTVKEKQRLEDRSEAEKKFEKLLCNNQYLEHPLTFNEMFNESIRTEFNLDKFYEEYPLASHGRESIETQAESAELFLEVSSEWQSDPDDLDWEPEHD